MMVGLWILVTRTKLGKAMRATAFDREAAAMMGIDVDRVIVKTFFIGSALAGAAGVLVGLVFGQINHFMGVNYGLKGFTAAVVGGIGSIPGAMFGGLFIGLAEAFSVGYIEDFTRGRLGSAFSDLVVFLILVVFMPCVPASSGLRYDGLLSESEQPGIGVDSGSRARARAQGLGRAEDAFAARPGVKLSPVRPVPALRRVDYLMQVGSTR
jgi:ABC-type uncharacterized transport system permease subunit